MNCQMGSLAPRNRICFSNCALHAVRKPLFVNCISPLIKKATDERVVLLVECPPANSAIFIPSQKGTRTYAAFANKLIHRDVAFRNAERRSQTAIGRLASVEKDEAVRMPVGALERVERVFEYPVQVGDIDLLICVVRITKSFRAAVTKIVKVPGPKIIG